jgi:hypothetical protein
MSAKVTSVQYHIPQDQPTDLSWLSKRLNAHQAFKMPPPATPATHFMNVVATTPASGLDLRSSMTPYETPSRHRISSALPQKRKFEESVECQMQEKDGSGTKASKRHRSMQTRGIIDANGLSSPAAMTDVRR